MDPVQKTQNTSQLKAEDIKTSWSGRGRCLDNILMERL